MGGWRSLESERGVVHVIPVDDLVEHELDERCACGPSAEIVLNERGPDGHVWSHHSLDGREGAEVSDA